MHTFTIRACLWLVSTALESLPLLKAISGKGRALGLYRHPLPPSLGFV
jgi:hypothetical protein